MIRHYVLHINNRIYFTSGETRHFVFEFSTVELLKVYHVFLFF